MEPLQEVTPEEITASRLRRMARDLMREADAIEARVAGRRPTRKHPKVLHEEFRELARKINNLGVS